MKFEAKSEKEIAENGLLAKGEYDYEVVAATEEVSKSGNEMIKLRLNVFDGEIHRVIYDYLLAALPGKLKHFCDSHKLADDYESGTLSADQCVDLSGRCLVVIQKDKTGAYPDKNQVQDYLMIQKPAGKNKVNAVTENQLSKEIEDDDIPF